MVTKEEPPTKSGGGVSNASVEEYVLVTTASKSPADLVKPSTSSNFPCIEVVPFESGIIPFLPLRASTEITLDPSYSQAILEAQKCIDSRLELFSEYQKLRGSAHEQLDIQHRLLTTSSTADLELVEPMTPQSSNDDHHHHHRPGLGWKHVDQAIHSHSRKLLQQLEERGVYYVPLGVHLAVQYFKPVAPNGDCLYLSLEQIIKHSRASDRSTLPSSSTGSSSPLEIRHIAAQSFASYFDTSPSEVQVKLERTISNLYFPTLESGWGLAPIQSRRYVAKSRDRDWLFAQVVAHHEAQPHLSFDQAAEDVVSKVATPVTTAQAYCRYIRVGHDDSDSSTSSSRPTPPHDDDDTDFLITCHYRAPGVLVSVDQDPEGSRVSWGDDLVLESLARAFERDIFVVLVGAERIFFLPHRDLGTGSSGEKESQAKKLNEPWFLFMKVTGNDSRGGDHYEPMLCTHSICGSFKVESTDSNALGSIGEM